MRNVRNLIAGIAVALIAAIPTTASAGSIYLTGHDSDFHSNQNGYDQVILNWLRGAGTGSEIAAGDYDILVLRSAGVGSITNPAGFGTVTQADPTTFDWSTLALYDVIEIASHVNCGGCALTTAGSNAINAHTTEINDFFNAGGDIYANSGADLDSYYDFLPPSATASGMSIGDSCGFSATAAGLAIGINGAPCGGGASMINGFPTHNEFDSFAAIFTVFETRLSSGGAVSIGVRDARIIDTIIVDTDGTTAVPEPASMLLIGSGLAAAAARRRRAKK
jgi:hypothetical protein